MAKASHGHFGQVPQTSFGLPTQVVNDKGRYRQQPKLRGVGDRVGTLLKTYTERLL